VDLEPKGKPNESHSFMFHYRHPLSISRFFSSGLSLTLFDYCAAPRWTMIDDEENKLRAGSGTSLTNVASKMDKHS
jgi:hypothetical protein